MTTFIEPPKSEDLQWHTSVPPTEGWYPCSFKADPGVLRYHFGDGVWSNGFGADTSAEFFDMYGEVVPADPQPVGLQWAEPWWPAISDEPVSEGPTEVDLFAELKGDGNALA